MHAAIQRSIGVGGIGGDEPRLAYRAAGSNEGGHGVSGAIQCSQRYLRVGPRVNSAVEARAGAADCGFGMALRTTIAIEGGSQTRAVFSRNGAGNRVDFIEGIQRLVEEGYFVGVESGEGAAGSGGTAARSGISLGLKYSSAKEN